jgi:uncharacterized protein YndB with AHSA1/START domain
MNAPIEVAVDIAASPQRIWAVLIEVEKWPEWTPSMKAVQRLDSGPFHTGSKARIRQPRLPATVWQVTDFQHDHAFTWEAKALGARTIAEHRIIPQPTGLCTVVLSVRQTGFLTPVLRPLLSTLTRRYVEMEAQGLKRRCEQVSAAA